ncbi:MAG: ribonuclease [Burkholderiales bacterium]|nr:ribonuclease [Burkholderiales bacterium]MDE1927742.1 ribonuclease [Burkholderiales bacterium]MDE2160478.1 ribonuclease [Burkholderiales bacterium]MDE2502896.1 ribonuclease [Burkholderiales bacterium]
MAVLGLVAGLAFTPLAGARSSVDVPVSVAVSSLPPQARATYRSILKGGPFHYRKDGIVFGNYERQLPAHARGYYHEYTVKTPRSRNRGARRIVCGGAPPAPPEVCYYTDDHYASFRRIEP